MASHQTSKRLKALLRQVHFPVQRFKQFASNGGSSSNSSGGPSGSGGSSPWDGIVSGDPRAALIVLHWILFDMSPTFTELLLDRDYGTLQSLTDYKFVTRGLKMLRDEFSFRPQLTAEQFLTCGYAEVKMRLLADTVELVMRTHHALTQQGGGGGSSASSRTAPSGNAGKNVSGGNSGYGGGRTGSGGGSGWSAESDGGVHGPCRDGNNSPWNISSPRFHLSRPGSRSGSLDDRGNGSGSIHLISPSSPNAGSRSPPFRGSYVGVSDHPRYSTSTSSSGFSDEQNAPPPVRSTRSALRSCPGPSPVHPATLRGGAPGLGVPPQVRQLSFGDYRGASQQQQLTGVAITSWVREPGARAFRAPPGVLPLPSGAPPAVTRDRSPLGLPSSQISHAQTPPPQQQEHMPALNMEAANTMANSSMSQHVQSPSPSGQETDWASVRPSSAVHVPLLPPITVPTSPNSESSMPKLPTHLTSSVAAAGAAATAVTEKFGDMGAPKLEHFGSGNIEDTGTEETAVDSDVSAEGRREHSNCSSTRGGYGGGDGGEDAVLSSFSAVMAKTQIQIEGMLERQSRLLDERMGGIEQMLSARLTLLETKIHRLENHARSGGM